MILTRAQFPRLSRSGVVKVFALRIAGEPKALVCCPQCRQEVRRKKLPKHVATACTKRPAKVTVPDSLAIAVA